LIHLPETQEILIEIFKEFFFHGLVFAELNAWGERTIQVDCSFLPQDKKYTIEIFQDKKRSNKNANLYEHKIMDMDNKNIIEMFMASGGGFVMVIREK
jgi:alpha-glucosidase